MSEDPRLAQMRRQLLMVTVEEWLALDFINESVQRNFPNAKTAAAIKASPLYEALS